MKKLTYESLTVTELSLIINSDIRIPRTDIKQIKVIRPGVFSGIGKFIVLTKTEVYIVEFDKWNLKSVLAAQKQLKKGIKHPVIAVLACTAVIMWVMGAVANNVPAPTPAEVFQRDKGALMIQVDQLLNEGNLMEATDLYNKYVCYNDADWQTLRVKVETLKLETQNDFFRDKADLVKTLKWALTLGYGASRTTVPLYQKYDHIGDADWNAYGPKVQATVEYDAKIDAEKAAEKALLKARKQNFKAAFSEWDGSCYFLVDTVKQLMNDPRSFEHVETRCGYPGGTDVSQISMTFRGKNSFGATVANTVTGVVHWTDSLEISSITNVEID